MRSPGSEYELVTVEIPEPKENEVLIKVEACGVCHGDVLAKEGRFPGIRYLIFPDTKWLGLSTNWGQRPVSGGSAWVGTGGTVSNAALAGRANFGPVKIR